MHEDVDQGTLESAIFYIQVGDGVCAVITRNEDDEEHIYFPSTDHLGSIVNLADESNTIVYEQNFDAWGRYRDPQSWQLLNAYFAPPSAYSWIRGYTGHEHLPQFVLINMNARMYDPVLGRMLAPDNFISNTGSTQAYNRYTYANNNPLKYTDPDGNIAGTVIGMIVAAGKYAIQSGTKYGGWKANWNWEQFSISVFNGAVSGTVSGMIGGAFGVASSGPNGVDGALHINDVILNAGANALTHGVASYALSGGQSSAFYSSAFSAFVGSMGMEYGGTILNSDVGSTIFSAGIGGVASKISGGNFWEGAAEAALVHLTNQLQHRFHGLPDYETLKKNYPVYDNGDELSAHDLASMVGGEVEGIYSSSGNPNACALRLSYALNKSGIRIPFGGRGATFKGADGKNYYLSSVKMIRWMTGYFGTPITGGLANVGIMNGIQGIYGMVPRPGLFSSAFGHVTVWNGSDCIANSNCEIPSIKTFYFWKLK